MTHVGENIKRIRTEKKMTISDVANEHVSRGMISLIENGKTQPSIERLQHIARQLGVEISELVEEVPRSKMRQVLHDALALYYQPGWEGLPKALELMKPVVDNHSSGYEAARMNEMYARGLYYLYVLAIEQYNQQEHNNWEPYLMKAIEVYGELEMEWRAVRCYAFLADIEFDQARYQEAIQIIDRALEQLTVMDSVETKSLYIQLISQKAFAFVALGRNEEAHKQLDDAIQFTRDHLVLDLYYNVLNAKAWLYYDEQKMEAAREYVEDCRLFVQAVKNISLQFEHELTSIFLEEFFERQYEKAISIAEQLVAKTEASSHMPGEVKKEYLFAVKNLQARALTQLERYEEALQLFTDNQITINEQVQLNPLDFAIRILSNSYEALCHDHLGNKDKAVELARSTVDQLHHMPYSSFYHFAKEVLMKVTN
ncbi:helix-turn-helix domain-containing protein [Sporosarcina cyprini]|uniref:helix-turn-helix domain-containing protein n=1 Tax=Sporosarcina cyprini TaxID=2910523 RepID=UPI001EE09071|nr:helix-turn-helix domain-containing protein [Sporosarcina cyprini]MCG3087206.1 helix-turn-helix domain-containing protein [Sporosarcina cyprini]